MLLALRILIDGGGVSVACAGATATVSAPSCFAAGDALTTNPGASVVATAPHCQSSGDALTSNPGASVVAISPDCQSSGGGLAQCALPSVAVNGPACAAIGVQVERPGGGGGGSAHYRGHRRPSYAAVAFDPVSAIAGRVFAQGTSVPTQAPSRKAVAAVPGTRVSVGQATVTIATGVSLSVEGAEGGAPIPRDPWRRARWVHALGRSLRVAV